MYSGVVTRVRLTINSPLTNMNKTKVVRADLLDLDFDFEDIFRFGNISGEISVFVTFQFWQNLSFGDISVLVTFQFWRHFSFGDISVWGTFQFW